MSENGNEQNDLRINVERVGRGTPGQVRITIDRGGTRLWDFVVVRPAASSGTNGSGVELRRVANRGKRVLGRKWSTAITSALFSALPTGEEAR